MACWRFIPTMFAAAIATCLASSLLMPRGAHAGACYGAFSREEFPHCTELGPNGTYSLHWKVCWCMSPVSGIKSLPSRRAIRL